MNRKINVTIFNEYYHEIHTEKAKEIYPNGIHGALIEKISPYGQFNFTVATMDMPNHGLTDEVLNNTDVLIWWAHCRHAEINDEIVQKVKDRVLDGMGFIALHSSHASKPFKALMGTSCRVKWRINDEKERLWVVDPSHPIVKNIPERIEIPEEETYGERFEIPTPDELVFVSWFSGGEVFRSGCCFKRGLGKIFYFRPGHETFPIYHRDDISRIISNAIEWACPDGITKPILGHVEPLEKVKDKFEGMDDALRKHEYIG